MVLTDFHKARTRWVILACVAVVYTGLGGIAVWLGLQAVVQTLILGLLFVWITIVDFDRFEIPDTAVVLLVVSGLAARWLNGFTDMLDGAVAGVLWSGLFYIVGVGYLRFRGFHGLGFGDVKLMLGIGIWLGFSATILVVLSAAISGIVAILLIGLLRRQNTNDILGAGVAFGPFLCLCAWSIWLFGESF